MLRFIGQRTAFIILVCVAIVFFGHMGMRMIPNSDARDPNYDLVQHAPSGLARY